jgi:hypothetical protein
MFECLTKNLLQVIFDISPNKHGHCRQQKKAIKVLGHFDYLRLWESYEGIVYPWNHFANPWICIILGIMNPDF